MALYPLQDLASTFSGDLLSNGRGDLLIADALDTIKSAVNFVLRTDHGDYAPRPEVGANLGSLIGELMSEEQQKIAESMITRSTTTNLLSPGDIMATVVPVSEQELACIIQVRGNYLISGQIQAVDSELITYSFPYLAGPLTPL